MLAKEVAQGISGKVSPEEGEGLVERGFDDPENRDDDSHCVQRCCEENRDGTKVRGRDKCGHGLEGGHPKTPSLDVYLKYPESVGDLAYGDGQNLHGEVHTMLMMPIAELRVLSHQLLD